MTNLNDLSSSEHSHETQASIIEMRLSLLIQNYLKDQGQIVAKAIVRQLEVLLSHPESIGYPDCRCGYKIMLQQWRCIST